jgi:hypothetical protein
MGGGWEGEMGEKAREGGKERNTEVQRGKGM